MTPVSVWLPVFWTVIVYVITRLPVRRARPASTTTLTMFNAGASFVSVNVQIVSTPDWIVRLSTPVAVGVPVDVGVAV